MPKKITSKLDEFGFDTELDNFDMDFDSMKIKDDRTPVTKVLSGVKKGVGATVKSESFISATLKNLFPKGYGDAFDTFVDTRNQIQSLYHSVGTDFSETLNDTKKVINKALPTAAQYLPGSLSKKLEKLTENYRKEADRYTFNDPNDYEITSSLTEIFKLQADAQDKKDHEQDVKDHLREGLSLAKHKENIGQLNAVRVSLSQLVTYQNKITSAYQKKSLELQYRQYFLSRDAFVETKKNAADLKSYLESINKNTALPDYVKLKGSERFGEAVRNRFIGSAVEGLFGNRQNFIRDLTRRVGDNLRTSIGNSLEGFRSGLSMLEGGADMMESANDMMPGMMPGVHEMVGQGIGRIAPLALHSRRLGQKVRGAIERKAPGLVKGGNELQFLMRNVPQFMNRWANSSSGDFNPFISFLTDPLKDAIRQGGPSRHVEVDNIRNLQSPGIFTRQTNKSINEVIPGLLAKIHQELRIMRTGELNTQALDYDYTKNKFEEQSKAQSNLFNTVVSPGQRQYFQQNADSLISQIDPNKTLSVEAKKALTTQMLLDNMNGRVGGEKHFTNSSSYRGDAEKFSDQFTQLFSAYFANDKNSDRKNSFNENFQNLGRFVGVDKENIQNIINAGLGSALARAGIVSQSNTPGEAPGEIDFEKLAKLYSGEGVNFDPIHAGGGLSNKARMSTRGGHSQFTPRAQVESFGKPCCDSIVTAIMEHSPLALLSTANSILGSIDEKLTRGITTVNVTDIGESHYKEMVHKGAEETKKRAGLVHRLFKGFKPGSTLANLSSGVKGLFSSAIASGKGADIAIRGLWFGAKRAGAIFASRAGHVSDTVLARGKELTDVFVGPNSSPKLEAWKFEAGLYTDAITGKVIKKFSDIKGSVLDDEGHVALSKEDLKYAYTRTKTGAIRRLTTLGTQVGNIGVVRGAINRFRAMDLTHTGLFARMQKTALSKAESIYDVYVKGVDKPVLQNWKLKAKKYRDTVTDKVITSFHGLQHDIFDEETGEVIALSSLKEAYTKTASGIKPFSILKDGVRRFDKIAGFIGSQIGDAANTGRKRVQDFSKWFFKNPGNAGGSEGNEPSASNGTPTKSPFGHTLGAIGSLGSLAAKAGNGAVNFLGSAVGEGFTGFFKVFSHVLEPIFQGRTIVKRLTEIRDMLDERLAGKKIREGSYEDQVRDKKATDAEEGQKSLNEKMGNLSGDWRNSIFGMGAGALGGLYKRFKDRNKKKEDEEGGLSTGNTIADTALGVGSASLLGRMGRGVLRGAKGLGRFALKGGGLVKGLGTAAAGMGLYDMAVNHDFSATNVASTALGAATTGWGRSAMMGAGRMALWGAGALISAVGLPVVLGGAAAATAGYFAYKYFTRREPQTLSTVRYIQYGFKLGDDDKFRKIMAFDEIIQDCVKFTSDTEAHIDPQKFSDKYKDILGVFEIDKEDIRANQNMMAWVQKRYRPIFLRAVISLKAIKDGVKLVDVDDKLETSQKLKFLDEAVLKMEGGPYNSNESPFRDETSTQTTAEDVQAAYTDAKAKLEKELPEKDRTSVIAATAATVAAAKEGVTKAKDAENVKSEEDKKKEPRSLLSRVGSFFSTPSLLNPFSFAAITVSAAEKVVGYFKDMRSNATKYVFNSNLAMYGFQSENHYADGAIITLDAIAAKKITGIGTTPKLSVTDKGDIEKIFKVFKIDPNDDAAKDKFFSWLSNRYVPILALILRALEKLQKPSAMSLAELDFNLTREEKIKYLKYVTDNMVTSAINFNVNPFGGVSSVVIATGAVVHDVLSNALSELDKAGTKEDDAKKATNLSGNSANQTRINVPSTSFSESIKSTNPLTGTAASNGPPTDASKAVATSTGLLDRSQTQAENSIPVTPGGVRVLKGNAAENRKLVIATAKAQGITDPKELAMFLAQMDHESQGFTRMEESFAYRPDRLLAIHGGKVGTLENAQKLLSQGPIAVANAVYTFKKGTGNTQPGDGWKYRGRGFIQLTGRYNYTQASRDLGLDLVNNPDLAAEPGNAAKIAIWYWKNHAGTALPNAGKSGDVRRATKLVNGGENGLAERAALYQKYLGMVQSGTLEPKGDDSGSDASGDSDTSGSSGGSDSASASSESTGNGMVPNTNINPLLGGSQNNGAGGAISTGSSYGQSAQSSVSNSASVDPSDSSSSSSPSINPSTFSSFNPVMSIQSASAQQSQNSQALPSNMKLVSDSMNEGTAVSRQILDVNNKQLEALVEIVKTLSAMGQLNPSQVPKHTDSVTPSNSNLDVSNSPIHLNKRFAA